MRWSRFHRSAPLSDRAAPDCRDAQPAAADADHRYHRRAAADAGVELLIDLSPSIYIANTMDF
jgi:hypothetical protein